MHFSSPSLTSIRRHSALSLPTLHGWPHLRKRARVEKKQQGRVLCRHKPPVSIATWLFCPDYRSVWIVLQRWWVGGWSGGFASWSVRNTQGSQAAAGRLCCRDLMEISRKLLKCSEPQSSYKVWIGMYKKRKWERDEMRSYLEIFECLSLVLFPMVR